MRVLPFLFVSFLFFVTCQNKPTEPKPDEDKPRRDYVWEVDSLWVKFPYNQYDYIWGDSPDNIWIAGDGDGSNSVLRYDGEKWHKINLEPHGLGAPVPWSIYGFSANDVWVGGADSDIWHYNLIGRTRYNISVPEGYGRLHTMNIWGYSPDNIWAVGSIINNENGFNEGVILHFNGVEWKITNPIIKNYYINKIGITTGYNEFFMTYHNNQYPDSNGVFYLKNNQFKSIYFDKFSETGAVDKVDLYKNSYIVINRSLYKYSDDKFIEVLSLKDYIQGYTRLFGRNLKDIFYKTDYGIGHYNGTDGEMIFHSDRKIGITNALILERDIYFTCYYFPEVEFFMLHGKLTD